MKFTVYRPSDGAIIRTGSAPEHLVAAQAIAADEAVLIGSALEPQNAWRVIGGDAVAVYPPDDQGPGVQALLQDRLRRHRQKFSDAGASATLPDGQVVTVDTARDQIAPLTSMVVLAGQGLASFPMRWKGGGVYYTLADGDALSALAAAAQAHVQAAYSAEDAVLARIISGEITEADALDAAWDAQF